MNPNNITIGFLASALGGAGITELATDFTKAMVLVGISVALMILVAVLNKFGVPVSK